MRTQHDHIAEKVLNRYFITAIEKVRELSDEFVRGSGDKALIGGFRPYIEKALRDGGVFFDVGESWDDLMSIVGKDKYGSFLANEEFLYILKDHGVKNVELVTELSATLDDGTKTTKSLLDWFDEFNNTADIGWDEMSYGQMEALALETSPLFSREPDALIWILK